MPSGPTIYLGDDVIDGDTFQLQAWKAAAGFRAIGVGQGDCIALLMRNDGVFLEATVGAQKIGAYVVPLNWHFKADELLYVLRDSQPKVLVAHADLLPTIAAELPSQMRVVVVPPPAAIARAYGPDRNRRAIPVGLPQWSSWISQQQPIADTNVSAPDSVIYTSGTTGRPKGAMLTHLNIAHSVLHYADAMNLVAADRSLVAVPLTHVTGLVAQLYTLLHCAGTLVLMRQFKAPEFMQLMERERITHAILVPAMYNLCLLLTDFAVHDLSAWRIGAYGGAPMPTATIEAIAARLPGLTLMNVYGGTETCSPATIMPRGQTEAHRDSVGRAVACAEIAVVDEHGRELPAGDVGEIWIAGPMVVPGYWRNPEATAKEFRAGYWCSGDIGNQDAEGYVRVLDRKKDMINRGGFKIYCATVENVLAEHPQVVESALVGVPCAVLGERVHAFVCVRAIGEATSTTALQAFCAARIADYAVPETWTIGTEPLPRNVNGKVMKRTLRQGLAPALT